MARTLAKGIEGPKKPTIYVSLRLGDEQLIVNGPVYLFAILMATLGKVSIPAGQVELEELLKLCQESTPDEERERATGLFHGR